MPYAAKVAERQRQLSTSLSTNTPSQSKMMRSGLIIARFLILIRAYTQVLGNNPPFMPKSSRYFPALPMRRESAFGLRTFCDQLPHPRCRPLRNVLHVRANLRIDDKVLTRAGIGSCERDQRG